MKFTLEIEMGNEAMKTKADLIAALKEVARRIPATLIGRIEVGDTGGIRDVNGNRVGKWEVID